MKGDIASNTSTSLKSHEKTAHKLWCFSPVTAAAPQQPAPPPAQPGVDEFHLLLRKQDRQEEEVSRSTLVFLQVQAVQAQHHFTSQQQDHCVLLSVSRNRMITDPRPANWPPAHLLGARLCTYGPGAD